jgi:hypothetical protein
LNITFKSGVFRTKRGKSNKPNGLEQHYYAERPHVLVEEECHVEKTPHVIDIVQSTPELLQDVPISEDLTEEEMHLYNLLALLHLLARRTQGRKHVVDYS